MIIDGIETYLTNKTGFIDGYVRAETEVDWLIGALHYGLLIESDGDIVDNIGVSTMESGTINGKVHYNFRCLPDSPANWKELGKNWTTLGYVDDEIHAAEEALVIERVALIDPKTIKSFELAIL